MIFTVTFFFLMKAAVLTGHGGLEKLEYRDVKIPDIGATDVLLKVLACGVNNTDVNLRVGWYVTKTSMVSSSIMKTSLVPRARTQVQ
jgi:NADPH:quinone reductase-like Zn-dependent oxidoreductase